MNIYYVYFYLRSNDSKTAKAGTPYYVGKGKNRRAWGVHKNNIRPKDASKIILVEQNLTELQAFILERYYIRWFGRKDIGTGILLNRTNGGDGACGYVNPKPCSEETKRKISESNKGKKKSTEAKLKMSRAAKKREVNPFAGKRHTKESKEKQSKIKKGKKRTEESRLKQSLTTKGHKTSDTTKEKISVKAKNRALDGSHNFLPLKGTVPCINKKGEYERISKQTFHSQSGEKSDWEWVHNLSSEGKRRRSLF